MSVTRAMKIMTGMQLPQEEALGVNVQLVRRARADSADAVRNTPLLHSLTLSELSGVETWLKFENLQMTGSFKERGALFKLLSLTEEERTCGVLAASAGNHALGLSYHAQRLHVPCTIVMPETTPLVKTKYTRAYGAHVILRGRDYHEAYLYAAGLAEQEKRVFVHPFDDPVVIAGQGVIGLEILESAPDLDAVIVPVGGGGLAAGVALALKQSGFRGRLVGVQTEALPGMVRALDTGQPVELPPRPTIADGIAVRQVGQITLRLAQQYLDTVVTVDEEEIANAVLLLLEIEKTVAEGAAAAPLAALLNRDLGLAGKKAALVISGGNIDVNILARVIDRGLMRDGRLARFQVPIDDRPGSLAALGSAVASCGANILQVEHRRHDITTPVGLVTVELLLETRGRDHIEEISACLRSNGYKVVSS